MPTATQSPVTTDKIVLFMPAYHAAKTLEQVYQKIPKEAVQAMFISDDASHDGIESVAASLGIPCYHNPKNLGYGGNVKASLQRALDLGATTLIELHPDDQYDPAAIPQALKKIDEGNDLVLGSRFMKEGAVSEYAMPIWKYVINRFSSFPARTILGLDLTDFHSGFRVYRRSFLEKVDFLGNSDDYLFSFQIIAQAAYDGFKVAEIPITCKYYDNVTQISFKKSMQYGVGALKTLWQFVQAKTAQRPLSFTKD